MIKGPVFINHRGATSLDWKLEVNEGFIISEQRSKAGERIYFGSDIPGEVQLSRKLLSDSGDYLDFEKAEALVRKGEFTCDNIKQINIGKLYYSESEILDGWINSELVVHVLNN